MIHLINNSLLNAEEQYIAHQCNCVSTNAAGLASAIFGQFPHANSYLERIDSNAKTIKSLGDGQVVVKQVNGNVADTMGTIKIFGNGKDERYVINMFAQFFPGKTQQPFSNRDGIRARERAFENCLQHIAKLPNLKSIAFPHRIGCGLAGGDWDVYIEMLKTFADGLESKGIRVAIYKHE